MLNQVQHDECGAEAQGIGTPGTLSKSEIPGILRPGPETHVRFVRVTDEGKSRRDAVRSD